MNDNERSNIALEVSDAVCYIPECIEKTTSQGSNISDNPNIVYILVDDLGYGDVQCLNSKGRIPTPNIDRIAKEGMRFTDAHASAAVCTPSRYGILTGRYSWRSCFEGVVWGHEPAIIENDRLTVGKILQQYGYATAAIGKWHLGRNWVTTDGKEPTQNGSNVDYSKPFSGGPIDRGFDYFFGTNSINVPPFAFAENDRTVGIPDIPHGTVGFKTSGYELVNVQPTLTQKAIDYINSRKNQSAPFFLYFPMTAVHGPIVPSKEWQGRSGMTPYADFVMQVDGDVGRILDALDRNGLAETTLVIFTSDNGCAPSEVFALREFKHNPSYVFRGYKLDLFEGGHRIPFIARWPGKIKPDSVCNDTVCLTDLMATVADILDYKLPDNAGEDSISMLPALLGTAQEPLREATVYTTYSGALSVYEGKWKLIFDQWSGGFSQPPADVDRSTLPPVQLYDLSRDIGETTNLQDQYPDVVEELTALMQSFIDRGRSTPGDPQKNDKEIICEYFHSFAQIQR